MPKAVSTSWQIARQKDCCELEFLHSSLWGFLSLSWPHFSSSWGLFPVLWLSLEMCYFFSIPSFYRIASCFVEVLLMGGVFSKHVRNQNSCHPGQVPPYHLLLFVSSHSCSFVSLSLLYSFLPPCLSRQPSYISRVCSVQWGLLFSVTLE